MNNIDIYVNEFWVVVGDFNNVLGFGDRIGIRVLFYEYEYFKECRILMVLLILSLKGVFTFGIINNKGVIECIVKLIG